MANLAYALDGTRVPFDSEKACLYIQVIGRESGHRLVVRSSGLPSVPWFCDSVHEIGYLPDSVRQPVEADLKKLGVSPHEMRFHLPWGEESARHYAKSKEELYKSQRAA